MDYWRNPLTDYSPQLEMGGPVETSGRAPDSAWVRHDPRTVFSAEEELDLASEFLEVRSERDLDHYVRALIDRASRSPGAKLDEPVEQHLGGIFKKLGRAILPMADPLRSPALAGGSGAGIGHALGLELEGLSPEDSEFEIAKQFVRFAGGAIRNAQEAGSTGDPAGQAHDAAARAAQLHAPGLMDIHDALSVDRPAERPDRSARPAPSPRPNGEKTMDSYERGQFGPNRDNGGAGRSLSEEELTNLAAELMQVTNEQEFENFLGDLISKGVQAIGKFVSSPTGKALGGALKDAAKSLLPIAGTAVGTYFGGPIGAQIGGTLGSAASNLFEAEAEAEEREWEAANVFVRVAVDAVNNAADAPAYANPHDVAHHAVSHAMRRYAPYAPWHDGHDGAAIHHGRHRRHEGSWVRHGHTIVVHGVA